MLKEFLNFAEISKAVSFRDLLDALNVPYSEKKGELHGDGFIVNIAKNLFFMQKNENIKGSPINFLAHYKGIELRDAATELKKQFLTKLKEPKREIPDLTLEWNDYIKERGITPEVAKEYEIGLVKQRSVVSGRIAFKVYGNTGHLVGYIGYKQKDNNWFYPKGFKRPLYNLHKIKDTKSVIVTVDPFDSLRIISSGFKQTVSLLSNSMTAEQEEQLKRFRYVLLFHEKPENIVNRLYQASFVYAPVLLKPLKELSNDDLVKMIKPS